MIFLLVNFVHFSTGHFDCFLWKFFIYLNVDLYLSFVSCKYFSQTALPLSLTWWTLCPLSLEVLQNPWKRMALISLPTHTWACSKLQSSLGWFLHHLITSAFYLSRTCKFSNLQRFHKCILFFFCYFIRIWGGQGGKYGCSANHIEPKTEGIT